MEQQTQPNGYPDDIQISAQLTGRLDVASGDFMEVTIACAYPECPEKFTVESRLGMITVGSALNSLGQHWVDVH